MLNNTEIRDVMQLKKNNMLEFDDLNGFKSLFEKYALNTACFEQGSLKPLNEIVCILRMTMEDPSKRWSCEQLLSDPIFEMHSICDKHGYFIASFVGSDDFASFFEIKCFKTDSKYLFSLC